MGDTEFIESLRQKDFIAESVRKEMNQGQAFMAAESLIPKLSSLFGDIAATLMLQLDNGYLVYFNPKKVHASTSGQVMGTVPLRAHAFGQQQQLPTPDEEREYMQKQLDRRRAFVEARERSKGRVRVYPALSQAMDEIKEFYTSGGVVPGIDYKKLAEEKMNQSDGPDDLGTML